MHITKLPPQPFFSGRFSGIKYSHYCTALSISRTIFILKNSNSVKHLKFLLPQRLATIILLSMSVTSTRLPHVRVIKWCLSVLKHLSVIIKFSRFIPVAAGVRTPFSETEESHCMYTAHFIYPVIC